ncbi:MAG: group 1 truncated hemoglobin [Pelomonas sp.]|nr:group 1 truncated hemoglobin [Roseateles sp.]
MQLFRIPALAICVALGACAANPPPAPNLYARLGGEPVVSAVVTRTIARAAQDPRTMRSFDGIKLATLDASITQQLCAISGGGCHYEGQDMAKAHADLHIRPGEFDALVDMLREEFDAAHVDAGAKNELLKRLAPMKRAIVAAS